MLRHSDHLPKKPESAIRGQDPFPGNPRVIDTELRNLDPSQALRELDLEFGTSLLGNQTPPAPTPKLLHTDPKTKQVRPIFPRDIPEELYQNTSRFKQSSNPTENISQYEPIIQKVLTENPLDANTVRLDRPASGKNNIAYDNSINNLIQKVLKEGVPNFDRKTFNNQLKYVAGRQGELPLK